jgi:hypothetical protein
MFFYNKERHLEEYLQGVNSISYSCMQEEVFPWKKRVKPARLEHPPLSKYPNSFP